MPSGGDHVGGRLGDVVQERGGPGDEVAARASTAATRVVVDVVGVEAALLDADRGEQLGEHVLEQSRLAEHIDARRLGDGATSIRRSSSLTRSIERIDVRDACARIASIVPGASAKPSWATKRAARYMRSGSSANVSDGIERGAQDAGAEIGEALPVMSITGRRASGRAR